MKNRQVNRQCRKGTKGVHITGITTIQRDVGKDKRAGGAGKFYITVVC